MAVFLLLRPSHCRRTRPSLWLSLKTKSAMHDTRGNYLDQPYLLGNMLVGYCEVSMMFIFFTKEKQCCVLRLLSLQNPKIDFKCCISLPICELDLGVTCYICCIGTFHEKPDFDIDIEIEIFCSALQAVNLKMKQHRQNQKDALAEVTDVLRAICHAHRFLLALTGIPCLNKGTSNEVAMVCVGDGKTSLSKKYTLCLERTVDYTTCLFTKTQKFGLNAVVAIRVRSTYTCDCDYILTWRGIRKIFVVKQSLCYIYYANNLQEFENNLRCKSWNYLLERISPAQAACLYQGRVAICYNHMRT
ncbi:hypothetical protein G4B88_024970 [Cannabis sativa]|uniref:NLP1-9 GAF domain-containing protein n=1 Tax=Cannabis sativa TaxID=3483 RepID=A0A7J6EDH3_CANSA|nr:hypothetical protein G4B88_024970 [Cannabis sativa]